MWLWRRETKEIQGAVSRPPSQENWLRQQMRWRFTRPGEDRKGQRELSLYETYHLQGARKDSSKLFSLTHPEATPKRSTTGTFAALARAERRNPSVAGKGRRARLRSQPASFLPLSPWSRGLLLTGLPRPTVMWNPTSCLRYSQGKEGRLDPTCFPSMWRLLRLSIL